MSDSEDDYMSAKYLEAAAELEKSGKEKTYSQRRKEQLERQKQKGYIKPRAQMEQEAREQGLSTALGSDNVGMKMLMKMGFKQGSSLGKEGGLQNPIQLEMKKGRSGLGTESSLKRQMEEEEEEEMKKRQKMFDPIEFRQQMAARKKQQRYERCLHAAVSLCEKFDQEKGVEINILWLLKGREQDEEQQKGTEGDDSVRDTAAEEAKEDDLYSKFAPEDVENLEVLPVEDKLKKVVDYLRTEYLYCFWCSVKYEDADDLAKNCPGPEEDDH